MADHTEEPRDIVETPTAVQLACIVILVAMGGAALFAIWVVFLYWDRTSV